MDVDLVTKTEKIAAISKKLVSKDVFANRQGELMLNKDGVLHEVSCKPSFPWTAPLKHISLVNRDGEVLDVIETPFDLPDEQKKLVLASLANSGFIFEITQVEKLEEEFELRHWEVQTAQGPRSFQTALENWPRELPDGSFLIEDVFGDLYHLSEVKSLCSPVQAEVEALIY